MALLFATFTLARLSVSRLPTRPGSYRALIADIGTGIWPEASGPEEHDLDLLCVGGTSVLTARVCGPVDWFAMARR